MVMTPDRLSIRESLEEVKRLLDALPGQLEPLIEALYRAYVAERTIFLIGNGGSAAAASHFGQDLSKGTVPARSTMKRFRTIALTDNVSLITALANDEGYDSVFVQQLITLARPGDVVIAISGSGNSPNVLRAVEYATTHEMQTIGITGCSGGGLKAMACLSVHIPSHDMGLIEAVHASVFHLTVAQLRQRLAEEHATVAS